MVATVPDVRKAQRKIDKALGQKKNFVTRMPITPTSHFNPEWDQWNRDDHFQKHGAEVAGVLGRTPFGKWDYDAVSKDTVRRARLYFEAEHWQGSSVKDPLRAYFVDRHLLQGITDLEVRRFATFFPETFDGAMRPADLAATEAGDRLLKFKMSVRNKERGGIYQKVRKHHGFD